MASNECKLYHQARRPSYDRTQKAREQLLFGNARVSGPAAQEHIEQSRAADEEWRRRQQLQSSSVSSDSESTTSSTESMHGYGESWFENLNTLAQEYLQMKQASTTTTATTTTAAKQNPSATAMHNYGDSWFENLNVQREEYEHLKAEEHQHQHPEGVNQMHNYGTSWFEKYEPMWEDWQHVRLDAYARKFDYIMDSDDESCELGL